MKAYLEQGQHVWTAEQVRKHLCDVMKAKVSAARVRHILRNDFGMRYRVLKKVAFQGNSERCLVTRLRYAQKMFELLERGARIINIDESWLNSQRFVRKVWVPSKSTTSVTEKQINPRLSLILALHTDGR
mgnify:CR=1 FL=1